MTEEGKKRWRAAMWWGVGYSNGLSGEELANPQQLDPMYVEDYERGLKHGQETAGRLVDLGERRPDGSARPAYERWPNGAPT